MTDTPLVPDLWWSPTRGLFHRWGKEYVHALSSDVVLSAVGRFADLPADAVKLAPSTSQSECSDKHYTELALLRSRIRVYADLLDENSLFTTPASRLRAIVEGTDQ